MPPKTVGSWHLMLQGPFTTKVQVDVPSLGCLPPRNMLMSEGCAKLVPPLAWALWESWLWGCLPAQMV